MRWNPSRRKRWVSRPIRPRGTLQPTPRRCMCVSISDANSSARRRLRNLHAGWVRIGLVLLAIFHMQLQEDTKGGGGTPPWDQVAHAKVPVHAGMGKVHDLLNHPLVIWVLADSVRWHCAWRRRRRHHGLWRRRRRHHGLWRRRRKRKTLVVVGVLVHGVQTRWWHGWVCARGLSVEWNGGRLNPIEFCL